jgi:hypothetical protein
MKNTIRLLKEYQRNGVLSLRELKRSNILLYKLFLSNFNTLSALLKREGIAILDDRRSLKEIDTVVLYLRYYFDDCVNLSELRNKHCAVYKHISEFGKPAKVVASLGFRVKYDSHYSEEALIERLNRFADNNKKLRPLDKETHNRLHYRAKKIGMTVPQYLRYLGFKR